MKFLHRPVTSFEDASRNFEQLEAKTVLDETCGSHTFTWPGATNTQTATISHGLGRVPQAVLFSSNGSAAFIVLDAFSITASSFTLQIRTYDNSFPAASATSVIGWAAR